MRGIWLIKAVLLFVILFMTAQEGIMADETQYKKATFAGGCFWCMEPPFEKETGVVSVTSGYTGGEKDHPTYQEVSSGKTRHCEAVEIVFDPTMVSYERLLEIFWRNIDPTTLNRQFADRGPQYRTAIFYHDRSQKKAAETSLERLKKSGKFKKPIVTPIERASAFYKAEDYHQDYYKKHPTHYKMYRVGSGREGYLKEKWGDDSV